MIQSSVRVRVPLRLPTRLEALITLSSNLHWSWSHTCRHLWVELGGAKAWTESGHNPVRLLHGIPYPRLEELALDNSFLARFDKEVATLDTYMSAPSWWDKTYASSLPNDFRIAYFSAEFGIAECLPIYSGGLGVLAGDHCKAASDLGIPLIGVGFLYRRGYFRQDIDNQGWQVETNPKFDPYTLPIRDTGIVIDVVLPHRKVKVQLWIADVGRTQLILLDTYVDGNTNTDKWIAGNLYGGDQEMRMQQELILGIGGLRALDALQLRPTVCHMNEGHSAFLSLERIRQGVQEEGWPSDLASTISASGNVFTTHTPVPAGFDAFQRPLLEHYLADAAGAAGLSLDRLRERGSHPESHDETFNMAVFAVRNAGFVNGVAELHGVVSREMAQSGWPNQPVNEVPITHVTNGIHTHSFLSEEMQTLWESVDGFTHPENLSQIGLHDIWGVRNAARGRLVAWTRERLTRRAVRRTADDIASARHALDPNVLTIGFARRFATYKRGDLLLRDRDRIKRLLSGPRPVQIIFAGKAHPKDDAGKRILQDIVRFTQQPDVRGKIVFLEDYDLEMARYLVQGVDIWLNTPRRPMEASGTSGMKAIVNGALHCSILDGWWAEAYTSDVGFAIGLGDVAEDEGLSDAREAEDLYRLLEDQILPLFYERNDQGLPERWLQRVRSSMASLGPIFSTRRMVEEYTNRAYVPCGERYLALKADNGALGKELFAWKQRIKQAWAGIALSEPALVITGAGMLEARVCVTLGENVQPSDLLVRVMVGMETDGHLTSPVTTCEMAVAEHSGISDVTYVACIPWSSGGVAGARFRLDPKHALAAIPLEISCVKWG